MWKQIDFSFVATLVVGIGAGICWGVLWVCEYHEVEPPPGAVLTGSILLLSSTLLRRPIVDWQRLRNPSRG